MGMANLQRMAQQMQQEMLRIQTELESTIVDGSAGGGVVSGPGDRQAGARQRWPSTLRVVDPADVEMLQDLVLAAVSDALNQRVARDSPKPELGRRSPAACSIPGL